MIPGIGLTGTDHSMAAPCAIYTWLSQNGISTDSWAVSGTILPGFFRAFSCPGSGRRLLRSRQIRQWARDFYHLKSREPSYALLFEDSGSGGTVAITNSFSVKSEGIITVESTGREEWMQTAAGMFTRKKTLSLCGKTLVPCYSQGALDCALKLMGAERMLTFQLCSSAVPEVRLRRRDRRHMTIFLCTSPWKRGKECVQAQIGELLDSIRQECYDFLYF